MVAARWPFTSAPLPLACAFLGSPPCVARTEKNPPCAASTEKKNLPVFRWCLDAVPVPVPACGLCMPQKNERPSGSPTYLCRKKTSAFGLLALSPEKKRKPAFVFVLGPTTSQHQCCRAAANAPLSARGAGCVKAPEHAAPGGIAAPLFTNPP